MKMLDVPSKIKLLSLMLLSFVIMYCCCVYKNYATFNSIKVVAQKNAAVEYGSANYDIHSFIKKIEGEIVSVKNEVDTNVVGEQEVILQVKKDNIVKDIPIMISVVDSISPTIQLKEEKVVITKGDDYDLTGNIDFIKDEVDGDISYVAEIDENSTFYYHFNFDSESIDNVGEHEIIVEAKDKNGNLSTSKFLLEVVAPKVVYSQPVYANLPANASGGDLVSIAYSYIGYPYVSGGNGPYGFDCSGFVQYVYSRVGISVSRSASTQLYDGVAVSYENAQPGDILSWGYTEGVPTHSALYIGNGQMIHATNPAQGVMLSSVSGWASGNGSHILSVRRIQ